MRDRCLATFESFKIDVVRVIIDHEPLSFLKTSLSEPRVPDNFQVQRVITRSNVNKEYHTVGTSPKSNIKIKNVERGNNDSTSTQIHAR
jgi:hypothetical protein